MKIDTNSDVGTNTGLEPGWWHTYINGQDRSGAVLRTTFRVLASGALYYLSTLIAWALCFPDSKVSLFFPPHAVLVSVLLLVPARHWWAYTLAAVASHFVATQQAHWPPFYALHCEVFDAVQIIATAAGIRLLVKSPVHLITLRDAILFVLVAVVIVPFGTAFWGAAFTVSNHFGTRYWIEWRNLGISNAVTSIVLVPAILLGVRHLSAGRISAKPARLLEAGFLAAGILTTGVIAFDNLPAGPNASPALVYAPIPLLIWAALRFGPGGASLSMLVITIQAIWGTMHGHGPFLTQTPAENALALQLFLLVTATPVMLMAVVIEEEKRSKGALRESEAELLKGRAELKDQLRFERLGTDISSTLMRVPAEDLGKQIVPAMEQVAQFLNCDVATLALFTSDGTAQLPYIWQAPGTPGLPVNLTDRHFPWLTRELFSGRDVHIRTLDDFPPEGQTDRTTYEKYGLQSSLDVPVIVSGQAVGVLKMGSFRNELTLSLQIVERQRVLGNLLGNALVRARSELALRESEKKLALAATAGDLGLWLWNVQTNVLWATARTKEIFGLAPDAEVTQGMFYTFVHPEDRQAVEAGIAGAISGKADYETEYRICLPGGVEKWIAARGEVSFEDGHRPVSMTGIVLDITERRRDAMELARNRQELAHFSRVASMSELSGSLAHELNQPLGAILSNAQAAQRFLDQNPANIAEVREILADIISEDRRAGEVIRRMRRMLRKEKPALEMLDLNELATEMLSMIRSDLVARNDSVTTEFAPELPLVYGDRIQLQQVILNVLLNACDAMDDTPAADRLLTVSTTNSEEGIVLSVRDRGHGLAQGTGEKIFEPFYSTKAGGLGMGLAICRSILAAHGGRLTAENHPDGGAVLCMVLLPGREPHD